MNKWLLLILSLPADNTTVRMRAWRAVKAGGAVVLRDGVYLLPDIASCQCVFQRVAAEVREAGGTVFQMTAGNPAEQDLAALFDRTEEYVQFAAEIESCHQDLGKSMPPADAVKVLRKLRKTLSGLIEIDFFPTQKQVSVVSALSELESIVGKLLAPNEPYAIEQEIPRLDRAAFQKRQWATRSRPWVDRLASAWLIRRHIDPDAVFIWLTSVSDCSSNAIGFDFDGAQFTHVGERVTFEVLLMSFGLDSPALIRLGRLVHSLDVGGVRPAEAVGIERVLTGLKDSIAEDNCLLDAACAVFDGLHAAFRQEEQS
ncbi:MAG: chromate resistance protein ChrB domain-containing protein [Methylococcaceae bacterium]